jgi:integrative and conjugative element protein (TIGR02256 family)
VLKLLRHRQPSYVLIAQTVCDRFDVIAKECAGRNENGGILIGGQRGPHLDVVEMTVPASGDMATRYSFRRLDALHQRIARRMWRAAKETVTYIGEWHAHPHGGIEPSGTDMSTWKAVTRQQRAQCAFVLVTPEGWGTFIVLRDGNSVRRLEILERGRTGLVFG